jgi:hypothetical protein
MLYDQIQRKGKFIESFTVEENTEIFDAVHHFIIGSRRFT